jgi:hypothetical protein
MKIVQAAVLVLVGALGAMLYVKVKGGPEVEPVPIQASSLPEAKPLAQATPAEESPAAPSTEVAIEPTPAPAHAPVHRGKKPARLLTSSLRNNQPYSNPVDIQPTLAPQPAPNPLVATPPPAPAPVVETAPQPVESPAPAPPPPPKQATLKAGTLVAVRLIETVSSDKNHPGDAFSGTLDAPLVVDGLVLAERGARVEGKIVASQQAGRIKGLSSIVLELTRVNLSDGQRVEISTDSFTKMGPQSRAADAEKIGGGAALGAIIGAIAGGGKGAAIGAGVGGAAGTGTVAATRGKPAVLASETKISFRINNTITVTERRRRS